MPRTNNTFTVGWLYPDLMNIYGDRGNILTLLKRAEWRGYEAKLIELGRGTTGCNRNIPSPSENLTGD